MSRMIAMIECRELTLNFNRAAELKQQLKMRALSRRWWTNYRLLCQFGEEFTAKTQHRFG